MKDADGRSVADRASGRIIFQGRVVKWKQN
jgi:hypothetical protein